MVKEQIKENTEFDDLIKEFSCDELVNKMKLFNQHYDTSCYEHCVHVAFYSYLVCKKLGLDYVSATRAAMVHDLFLYDWRLPNKDIKGLHAFAHPKIAFENASKRFSFNEKEKDAIVKHMWPLTVKLPRYKESYVVSFADKYSAIKESMDYYKSNLTFQKIYRYSYVFLSLVVLRIANI